MRKQKKRNPGNSLYRKFPSGMQKKLVFLFFLIILAFMILIGRIIHINISKGEEYKKIVMDRQRYESRVIPYRRGSIIDRNGTKLAYSVKAYNLILDVKILLLDPDDVGPTIQVLKDVFGLEGDEVKRRINDNPESHYQILARDVTFEKAQELKNILADNKNYPDVEGLWLEEYYRRVYPYGSLASDVVGFLDDENNGVIGLECEYNDVLKGTDGREYDYFGSDSSVKRMVKAPRNGNDVEVALDVALQGIIMKHIREFNDKHAGEYRAGEGGSTNTAVMIMDPDNGEILAQASCPEFDLNSPRDLSAFYTQEQISAMTDKETVKNLYDIWNNFCVNVTFEPGSTFKPFAVAAGLETGAITGNETYLCEGSLTVAGKSISCHKKEGHGVVTVKEAIAKSCNVALMKIARSIGPDDFIRYQHIFGFGEPTGVDLPGEPYTGSLLYTPDSMKQVELATNSFGQGFNVTMTQMTAGFCSLINGGAYYRPHVVRRILDGSGNVTQSKDPVLLKKTVSSRTSEMIKGYLREVMISGTGKKANIKGYDVGAKTGTAEKFKSVGGKLIRDGESYLLSFIACAPYDDPEVVIYVVIDEPNVRKQDTSEYVLKLSKDIMEDVFPYLDITKAGK